MATINIHKVTGEIKFCKLKLITVFLFLIFILPADLFAQPFLNVVPDSLRGNKDWEREGQHDANKIRTKFYNYGMVGDYPPDPLRVDLSVFHSMEWPKGSGENYSDGHTPYVLAKIMQTNNVEAFIMETGYRERQSNSPIHPTRIMRYEPRPGYFQPDKTINQAESPAMSNDPRTWPDQWIDKLNDPDDPGWSDSWNGYFGKAPGADQESFIVYDDQYYDAWNFYPDNRDETRRGLALKVEQRGFQWSNPQAGDVIFWHYDITNEGTTTYDDNIIFGIYLDSGVGGSGVGRDNIPESDDDNASYEKTIGLNVVYTWDKNGYGARGQTGYLGYSYLETPGNGTDGVDNDQDGITDELRDGGPGQLITGQAAIRAYVQANYNLTDFENFFAPLEELPAYQAGVWYTGDEDMDWIAEFHDTGADGIFADENNPPDTGERDGIPTRGEPNFDRTDVDESDQIGLTGFKMNRIRAGEGAPTTEVDGIVFYMNELEWPKRLYEKFTAPVESDRFDQPLVLNYNIGFLFASGTFKLEYAKTERFSLAQGFGRNLRELQNTLIIVSQIYKANYQFAVPPPLPTVNAFAGDGFVTLTWDDAAERAFDPITLTNDFEGYRIYRSTDPAFLDPQVILTGTGTGPIGHGKPIAQFDLINDIYGFSTTTVEGVAYFLGDETGITHHYIDTTVTNGQTYFYAVTAYDRGQDSTLVYPSENAISVSQTLRGGTILAKNVVEVRPNPPVVGYKPAEVFGLQHSMGNGSGNIELRVLNPALVPNNHQFEISFINDPDSIKAEHYLLIDVTDGDTLFRTGTDFAGLGVGPAGKGILPIISTPSTVVIDSTSGFTVSSTTNARLSFQYNDAGLSNNLRRAGYPSDIKIIFSDTFIDTTLGSLLSPGRPVKFTAAAVNGDQLQKLRFRFIENNNNGVLDEVNEVIQIVTYADDNPNVPVITWRVQLDTTEQYIRGPLQIPTAGDEYILKLNVPFGNGDVFTFNTSEQKVDEEILQQQQDQKPYVVPNPYVAAASFEPQRFAVSGRGERRIEFRGLPQSCTIRIFTVSGELVRTLQHNGDVTQGYVAWDLRTKDNLEVAPGLYIFHVESEMTDPYIGKFAIIK